jgi:hypothetical protein
LLLLLLLLLLPSAGVLHGMARVVYGAAVFWYNLSLRTLLLLLLLSCYRHLQVCCMAWPVQCQVGPCM